MRYLDESRYDSFGDYVNTLPVLPPDQLDRVAVNLSNELTGEATFTPIASSVNDYPLANGISLRISATGSFNITGLANVWAGRIVFLMNVGSIGITLTNQDAASQPQNRIITSTGGLQLIAVDQSRVLVYDGVVQRWRLVAT